MKIGLIGKNVSNSFSKLIHEYLLECSYELISIKDSNGFKDLINQPFDAYNVTIPYKELAFQLADVKDESTSDLPVSNLLIKQNNKITAYNTDIFGFTKLLEHYQIDVNNKKCLIIGTGSTSKTVAHVLKTLNAKEVLYLSRGKTGSNIFTYESLNELIGVDIIINASPIGHDDELNTVNIKNAADFKNLTTYIDLNYQYVLSNQAKEFFNQGVKCINGLYMLVAQAVKTDEIIQNAIYEDKIDDIFLKMISKVYNIVFIGHPLAGKTTIGQKLANNLGLNFVDIDEEIVKREKLTITNIFIAKGEPYFRDLESQIINEYSSKTGYVISLGGGAILNPKNIEVLQPKSIIINLVRDVEKIEEKEFNDRPLLKSKDDLEKICYSRMTKYLKYSSFTVKNNDFEEIINEIRSKL